MPDDKNSSNPLSTNIIESIPFASVKPTVPNAPTVSPASTERSIPFANVKPVSPIAQVSNQGDSAGSTGGSTGQSGAGSSDSKK